MKPVAQDKFLMEGNCFPACLASILECNLEQVPDFRDGQAKWFMDYQTWLREKYSLRMETYADAPRGLSIGTVKSPTMSGELHSVVCQDGQVVWDPLPPHTRHYDAFCDVFITIEPIVQPAAVEG
jgi:hypothetical protein